MKISLGGIGNLEDLGVSNTGLEQREIYKHWPRLKATFAKLDKVIEFYLRHKRADIGMYLHTKSEQARQEWANTDLDGRVDTKKEKPKKREIDYSGTPFEDLEDKNA